MIAENTVRVEAAWALLCILMAGLDGCVSDLPAPKPTCVVSMPDVMIECYCQFIG